MFMKRNRRLFHLSPERKAFNKEEISHHATTSTIQSYSSHRPGWQQLGYIAGILR
jgi:hypothetical protein